MTSVRLPYKHMLLFQIASREMYSSCKVVKRVQICAQLGVYKYGVENDDSVGLVQHFIILIIILFVIKCDV